MARAGQRIVFSSNRRSLDVETGSAGDDTRSISRECELPKQHRLVSTENQGTKRAFSVGFRSWRGLAGIGLLVLVRRLPYLTWCQDAPRDENERDPEAFLVLPRRQDQARGELAALGSL